MKEQAWNHEIKCCLQWKSNKVFQKGSIRRGEKSQKKQLISNQLIKIGRNCEVIRETMVTGNYWSKVNNFEITGNWKNKISSVGKKKLLE